MRFHYSTFYLCLGTRKSECKFGRERHGNALCSRDEGTQRDSVSYAAEADRRVSK